MQSPSQSQSPSRIPATQPKPVTQKVYGPGVAKPRRTSSSSSSSSSQASKKKSTPNTHRKSAAAVTSAQVFFEEMPTLDVNSIYWVVPEPGYGNPLNLSAIPENTGKVFVSWTNWESNDRVGYTLYDKNQMKYWADAASIHMLARAKLAGITHDYFFFTVFRQGKEYKYGFTPKSYLSPDQITMFENYKQENQKLAEDSTYIPRPIKIEKKHEEEEHQEEEEAQEGEAAEEGEETMPGADDIIEID